MQFQIVRDDFMIPAYYTQAYNLQDNIKIKPS